MSSAMQVERANGFQVKLAKYKKLIDLDIAEYTKVAQRSSLQNFGKNSRVAADAYLQILSRGGKRIRGALAMLGYEMSGGKDEQMILEAARAVEMIHAYILIMDDIMDRSPSRRGGPTAHFMLMEYHKKMNYSDDALHFGESIAANAALIGNHLAQMQLANLPAKPELLLNAISVINYGMATTGHGQINDIFNEVNGKVTERDVLNVLEWKTAHYTFLNPLTFGMTLAGAECKETDAIRDYALNAGLAFQITDDILGTFGEEFESGKSPLDDIREGKRTLLAAYALENAKKTDQNFLLQMLGNAKLSRREFDRCKEIMIESGALEYTRDKSKQYIAKAISSLDEHDDLWDTEHVEFLRGLANYLHNRSS
ncbi:MAG: polyprenyl synthetase family protein [bacterium]|nr:polyprenyl synthetase family protein [bacterium]